MDLEDQRLAALRSVCILDTDPQPRFDQLTQLAASVFDAPIALISLIDKDRQGFKATWGLEASQTPRDQAFCARTLDLGRDAVLVVEDAAKDPRFAANPLVTGEAHIRFYAGAALTTRDGFNLGTICVIDTVPRATPKTADLENLRTLARIVVDEIELGQSRAGVEERARLLKLTESMSGVGHWRLDLVEDRVTWSAEVYRIHGLSPDAFDPNLDAAINFYAPDEQRAIRKQIKEAAETGAGYSCQLRLTRRDGDIRHVIAKAECELGSDGKTRAITGVFQDITVHVRALDAAKAARKDAEEKARQAAVAERIAGLGHWRVDFPARTLWWSEQMYAIYGLEPGTPMEIDAVNAMIHPEDRLITDARLDRDLHGDEAGERPIIRIVRPDGAIRHVIGDARVERGPGGQVVALHGTLTDVTRQREADQILAQSEARYRLLAENATDMITTSDMAGRLTYASPSCETIVGYTPSEVVGQSALDQTHPDDQAEVQRAFRAVADGAPPERVRWRARSKKTDAWVWLESKPCLILDPETGDPVGFVDVVRDASLQVEHEEALREARAIAEAAVAVKSEFLANMSHELRTPLTAILGFSDLLRGHLPRGGDAAHYLDRVTGASHALRSIVNDILDFSKLEAAQVEIDLRPVDPAVVIENAARLLEPQAVAKGVALSVECAAQTPRLAMMDDNRVRQVVLNLVSNAVKFTDRGGVSVKVSAGSGGLRCAVTDTGLGIPADRLDRLFRRFSQIDASTTRSHGGTGLGLAICKGLVEAMGGRIGVESRLGEGSTFWFELPCPFADAPEEQAQSSGCYDQSDAVSGLRVLVADDNMLNRELIRAILCSADVEATIVSSGEEAVEACSHAPYDVILMDVRMPGLGGPRSAQSIRGAGGPNAATPILAFTADGSDGPRPADWLGAFDDAVAKPISPVDLFATLAKWTSGEATAPAKQTVV